MNKSEKLPSRRLGSSGIAVSAIGLGCMSFSGVYGASSDDDGVALIRDALDRGITFLDTSDAYGAGHNETLVGKAIKGRSQLMLAGCSRVQTVCAILPRLGVASVVETDGCAYDKSAVDVANRACDYGSHCWPS